MASPRFCAINECERKHEARDYCSHHYYVFILKQRRRKRSKVGSCVECGAEFYSPRRKYCSDECRFGESDCVMCGGKFINRRSAKSSSYGRNEDRFCSTQCRYEANIIHTPESRRMVIAAKSARRRAKRLNNGVEPYDRFDIYMRDGGFCGICGLHVRLDLKYPDPGMFSIDHVVPISLGGQDSPDNVQTSHLICNLQKSDKLEEVI